MRNIIAQLNFEINQLKITNSKLQAQNSSKGIINYLPIGKRYINFIDA